MSVRLSMSVLLAALLMAGIGCEDDSSIPADETGSATIAVNLANEPAQTYYVVFHHASGAVATVTSLDGSGRASAKIRNGDMVSLVRQRGSEWRINTVTGLQIGQTVELGRTGPAGPPATAHTIVVDADYPAGVSLLQIGSMCMHGGGGFTFPRSFQITDNCMTESGGLNFVLYALPPAGGRSHFAYAADVPPDPSGTTSIDLRGAWRTDWQDFVLTYSGAQSGDAGSVTVNPYRDGQSIGELHSQNWAASGSIDFPLQLPTGLAERLFVAIQFDDSNGRRNLQQRFGVDESSSAYEVTGAPPEITNLAIAGTDTDRPTMSWDLESTPAAGDAVVASISWESSDQTVSYAWAIHLPPGTTRVQFPELPDALAQTRPPTDGSPLGPQVQWVDDTLIGGYADYRRHFVERAGFERDTGDGKLLTTLVWLP